MAVRPLPVVPPFRKGGTGGILDAAEVICLKAHWYQIPPRDGIWNLTDRLAPSM